MDDRRKEMMRTRMKTSDDKVDVKRTTRRKGKRRESCVGITRQDETSALWAWINKNWDVSIGSLARPFARSLAPLTRSLAPDCSLRSRPPLHSLFRSLARSWIFDVSKWPGLSHSEVMSGTRGNTRVPASVEIFCRAWLRCQRYVIETSYEKKRHAL